MRRSAIESVQRGVANLAGNWKLVLVQLLQTLVVTGLIVAGAVPLVLVIGVGTFRSLMGTDFAAPGGAPAAAEDLLTTLGDVTGPLLLSTLVAGVVWTIAVVAYAYFQAGIYGVLAEGDRRAPSSARRQEFRSFGGRLFRRAADRGLWTFFWLINLFMALGTILAVIVAVVAIGVVLLTARENPGTALALGCFGGSFAAILAIAVSLWWQLAMATAAADAAGLWRSTVLSLRILARRAAAVLLLTLFAVVLGISIAIVFIPAGLLLELAVGDSLTAYVASQIFMSVIQSVFSAMLGIGLAGSLVALVRGELARQSVGVS